MSSVQDLINQGRVMMSEWESRSQSLSDRGVGLEKIERMTEACPFNTYTGQQWITIDGKDKSWIQRPYLIERKVLQSDSSRGE